jgi:hypothetical protein
MRFSLPRNALPIDDRALLICINARIWAPEQKSKPRCNSRTCPGRHWMFSPAALGDRKMDTKIIVALLIVATLLLLVNYFPSPL